MSRTRSYSRRVVAWGLAALFVLSLSMPPLSVYVYAAQQKPNGYPGPLPSKTSTQPMAADAAGPDGKRPSGEPLFTPAKQTLQEGEVLANRPYSLAEPILTIF